MAATTKADAWLCRTFGHVPGEGAGLGFGLAGKSIWGGKRGDRRASGEAGAEIEGLINHYPKTPSTSYFSIPDFIAFSLFSMFHFSLFSFNSRFSFISIVFSRPSP